MSAIEKNGPESPSPGMKGAAWTEHVRTSCCGESDSVTRIVTYCDLLSQNHHTPTFALCPSSPHLQSSGLYSLKIASHSHKTPTIQTSAAHQSSWWPPCHPCVTMTSSPHTHNWVWSQSGPYHQEARVPGSDLYYVWTFNNSLTKRLMAAINRRQSSYCESNDPRVCSAHYVYIPDNGRDYAPRSIYANVRLSNFTNVGPHSDPDNENILFRRFGKCTVQS